MTNLRFDKNNIYSIDGMNIIQNLIIKNELIIVD